MGKLHGTEMTNSSIRPIIDKYFSLQWCRENIVVPLGIETNQTTQSQRLTVAIGNFSYLATIGEWIKQRAANAGLECQFIEKPAHEIQALLDEAAQERVFSADNNALDGIEFNDDAVLDALKGVDEDGSAVGFDFDFDDSDEQIIEEQALDLSTKCLAAKYNKQPRRYSFIQHDRGSLIFTLNQGEMTTK